MKNIIFNYCLLVCVLFCTSCTDDENTGDDRSCTNATVVDSIYSISRTSYTDHQDYTITNSILSYIDYDKVIKSNVFHQYNTVTKAETKTPVDFGFAEGSIRTYDNIFYTGTSREYVTAYTLNKGFMYIYYGNPYLAAPYKDRVYIVDKSPSFFTLYSVNQSGADKAKLFEFPNTDNFHIQDFDIKFWTRDGQDYLSFAYVYITSDGNKNCALVSIQLSNGEVVLQEKFTDCYIDNLYVENNQLFLLFTKNQQLVFSEIDGINGKVIKEYLDIQAPINVINGHLVYTSNYVGKMINLNDGSKHDFPTFDSKIIGAFTLDRETVLIQREIGLYTDGITNTIYNYVEKCVKAEFKSFSRDKKGFPIRKLQYDETSKALTLIGNLQVDIVKLR
jgi:hypothetical protein